MKETSEESSNRSNKMCRSHQGVPPDIPLTQSFRSSRTVPVVIDPILARRLRPHQVEGWLNVPGAWGIPHTTPGVKFMYECVMGLRKHEGQGCILADEMYDPLHSWRLAFFDGAHELKGIGKDPSG
jgi:hypothetical protein